MRVIFKAGLFVLLISPFCFSQEPVPILSARWKRATVRPAKPDVTPTGPVTPAGENKYFQRKAREQRTDNPMDPTQESMEARSLKMDQAVKESRTPQPDNITGYTYTAEVRNETGATVNVIFWEYRFTETAHPENIVRRQFLCGVEIKNGEKKELNVFSTLGPSDVIGVDSLAKTTEKLFNEAVQVNRIELADGSIIQRDNWKFSDVKAGVQRLTSTPWGNEICRAL